MYGLKQLSYLWDSEEQRAGGREHFKVIILGLGDNARECNSYREGGFSLCNTARLKLYFKSCWVL